MEPSAPSLIPASAALFLWQASRNGYSTYRVSFFDGRPLLLNRYLPFVSSAIQHASPFFLVPLLHA